MQTGLLRVVLVLLGSLALCVSGCAGMKKTARQPGKEDQGIKEEIAYLAFSLPEQVQWERNPDEAEWTLAGYEPADSPARVMYQKLVPAQAPDALKRQVLEPLRDCPDTQVSDLRGKSKYSDQITIEAICSQFGKDNFGLISYIGIFSDQTANHLLITEVRTPASKKAGLLTFQNSEAQKQAEASKILSELLYRLMESIRVCDEKNLCI